MKSAYEKNGVKRLTVVQLKAWLISKRLETTGKKADLVERVEEYFDRKG